MSERELPQGWAWATVGEVGRVQLGRQRSPEHHQGDHMRPYLRVANVFEDRIDTTDVMEMNFTPEEFETYRLHPGDILLNEGQSRELVGRPAMFRNELDAVCFTNSLVRYQAGAMLVPEYALFQFRHWLRSGDFSAIANITTNIAHLGAGRFAEMSIALPPVAEQRRIVAKLDELLARSRRARAALAEVPALLARYRESVLAAAFRGDLTADWREANSELEPASVLLERIWAERRSRIQRGDKSRSGTLRRERQSIADSVDLPPGWDLAVWNDLADWITYGFTRPMPHVGVGVPIVTARHIDRSEIDFDTVDYTSQAAFGELSDKDRPRRGEILLTKDGSIGRAAVVNTDRAFCINQSVAVIRFGGESADANYLLRLIESPLTQRLIEEGAKGTAIKHVSITAFGRFPVPLAPLAEQHEIVRRIEAAFARIDAIEAVVAEQRARLDAYDRSLLARAFAGELVPQDPNDEPASVMLARLRAERGESAGGRGRRRRT